MILEFNFSLWDTLLVNHEYAIDRQVYENDKGKVVSRKEGLLIRAQLFKANDIVS